MNEQMRRHLAELNHKATSPDLVAVVQYDEETGEAVLLLKGQTLQDGEYVEHEGKKYKVQFAVKDIGMVPDEIDHSVVDRYVSTEAWDQKARAIVTTSEPVYGTRPGRTVYNAEVTLAIGGKEVPVGNGGLGSRVVCSDDAGTVVLRRWAFTVPATVWGYTGSMADE